VAQNRVVRYLLDLPPRTHIGVNQFRSVGMVPVEYRVNQLKLNHVFNVVNNKTPNLFSISLIRNQHVRSTRNSEFAVVIPIDLKILSHLYTRHLNCGIVCLSIFKVIHLNTI
jgi:hypothetical protein